MWSWQMVVGTGLGHSQWGVQYRGWKKGKENSRKRREGMAKSEEEPGLWGEVGSLVPEVAGTGWASGRATGVSMR